MADNSLSLEERLNAHRQLKGRMEALWTIVEEGTEEVKQADEAERRVIEALRRLGNKAVRSWAAQQEAAQSAAVSQQGAARAEEKNSTGTPRLGR